MDDKKKPCTPCLEPGEARENGVSRRTFLKSSGAVLGGALLSSQVEWAMDLVRKAEAGTLSAEESYELAKAENILYSVCLQCNTGCGIKVKLYKGIAVKIDGSAYNPFNLVPSLSMKTSAADAAKVDGAICPKGQAGVQTAYDPYRITKVLKRAGKRGDGKWTTIPFDKAVDEIVNGGRLFADVPGEENRNVAGLKEIYALRDPGVAKEMGEDAKAIAKAKDKKQAVEEFKKKHAANLHYLIDPDHPDFGPKNNQLVYMWGRKKGGRGDFSARFFGDHFGTVNTHGHTTVCQGSLYFTCKAMSEQYEYNKFGSGKKFYWQPDTENAAYILFAGSNLFDANYGPPNRSARITQNLVDGKTKITVVDPRFSKLAAKANRYLPVNPGEDAAFFGGIIQWIIGNKKYDAGYLSCANKAAAKAAGETTWSNAPLLVKLDKDGKPGKFLRAHEIGLAQPEKRKDKSGKEHDFEYLVAMKDGKPVAVDPNDEKNAVTGDLLVGTELSGIKVKSALQVVADAANAKSMAEWSQLCGIGVKEIEETAKELTSFGKRAAVDVHRGVAQHTNGFYNVTGAMTINLLLGNFDWKGGMIAASTYNTTGGKEGQPFDLGKLNPGKTSKFGISVIRHDIKYEDSTLFSGYPAKRNWWPISSDVYEEIVPSIGDAYPYPVKALFSYMGTPAYSLPAGHTNIEILSDVNKVPLYFCSDILIGTTSMYADYIFPDLSYLERWEMQGSHPNMPVKIQPIRQPAISPIPETVKVFGEEMPCSYEALQLALAEKLGMKGYGKDGFGPGQDFTRPDDYYIRMVANVATDGTPVPDADDAEVKLFMESRKHLPRIVFDPARWEKIAGASWRKVVYLLNRGGRFQEYKDIYKGNHVSNQYKSLINMYQEKTAGTRNAFTGKSNPGYATYVPVASALGKSPKAERLTDGYPLHLLTQRDVTMTKSRTVTNYWLLAVYPENHLIVNPVDAKNLNLKDGDTVRVVSATNKEGVYDLGNGKKKAMAGKVKLSETIMPGAVTFTLGHGHWATGAADVTIDGKVVKGDPRRGTGVHANAAMWIDPHLKNTCMLDPVGGSVSFYDTKVNLVKV
ncbi:MAG: molybdopterin-dependent oxidoreductase [Deltaproteobacteria bacterium]|nr:molybdopterin-dependent oxidoreductase [Deltaproteobacteria bacterium]